MSSSNYSGSGLNAINNILSKSGRSIRTDNSSREGGGSNNPFLPPTEENTMSVNQIQNPDIMTDTSNLTLPLHNLQGHNVV